MLVTGLTLIAAGLSRQVSAMRVIETMQISRQLADRLLIREILLRKQDVESTVPEVEGFHSSVSEETARIPRYPMPEIEINRVTGEVSWELRGRSRSVRLETGIVAKRSEPAQ